MRRSVVVAVVAWVAVVAAASGLTWAVISSAGQQALSGDRLTTPDALPEPSPLTASPPTVPAPTAPVPTITPSRTAPTYVERVWRGTAGTVVARCVGGRLDLRSATPNDRYHVDVEASGPDELEVGFDSELDEVKVRGTCRGGVPRFDVESRNDDGD